MKYFAICFLLTIVLQMPVVVCAEESGPANVAPSPSFSSEQDTPLSAATLVPADCRKCHDNIFIIYERFGESHSTKITCIDCHDGHPPRKRDIIPACSKCHKDHPHFQLDSCLKCHQDPHAPLQIHLTRKITHACATCHANPLKQLQENPSIHSTLDCTACHTRHGYLPECFRCHKGHLETMTNKDCKTCHLPHMPLQVTYPDTIPPEYCGSCHKGVYAQLAQTHAKHRYVTCVQCHQAKHKTIPSCRMCHKAPHPQTILSQFSSCGECHGKAHDLQLNQIDIFLEQDQKQAP